MKLPVVFAELGDLAFERGARSIKDLPGCYEMAVDENWWVAINGHGTDKECSRGVTVPAWSMYVEWCGWPAGIINAGGGTIAAGSEASEDTLIAAIAAAKESLVPGAGESGEGG